MTTTTYNEYHPHIGSVWARAVQLWSGYMPDSTVAFAYSVSPDGPTSRQQVTITLTGATDTNIWVLKDAAAITANASPIRYVSGAPGWNTMPAVMPATQGGRTTLTNWHTQMIALRRDIWNQWCQPAIGTERFENFNLNYPTLTADIRYWTIKYDSDILVDSTQMSVATQTATQYIYGSAPFSNPEPLTTPTVYAQGGGGSVDLTATNAILSEIANIDVEYDMNHGANIFSMRSRVRTGP